MVKTENARRGHSFEEMLKDYIDCKKDNDATSEFLTDMPDVNRMSEGNSSESTEVEHVVTTIVDDVFEIECSSVAEEIIIEDVKVFDTSSPNSEVIEVIENNSVEELQSPIVNDVNEIITDERINSKQVSINNEFDTFFDKIPSNNDPILVNDLMEIDIPREKKTTSQRTEDVDFVSKDISNESISQLKSIESNTIDNKTTDISQSNSTEKTIEPSTDNNKTTEISHPNLTENGTESSIKDNTVIAVPQSNSTKDTIESNINDNKTAANEVSDKPYKCDICGKFFSRASSLKCHVRLHREGPDSILRGSSEPVDNSVKSQYVELNTKKEEVVEPVAEGNAPNTAIDDETGSNVLNSSRDSCDLTEDEEKREYKCIVCEKTFSRRSSLTCHYKFHPKSPVSKNQEDIPAEIINDENAMEINQVEESAAKEELYKCDKCPRTFSERNTYIWHTKMHETNVRKKSSDNTADTTSPTKGVEDMETVDITNDVDLTANNIEKTHAADLNLYKCHLCPRSFPQLRGLKTHSGVHRRKQVHEQSNGSEIVNDMFYEEVSSRKNACCTKNHNHDDEMTKLYKCNVCCKCFCDMNNLKAHLARNHQEEDTSEASDNDFVVESQSNYVAANNESGISHKLTTPRSTEDFKEQKPNIIIPGLYKCGVCSETFDEIQLLADHVYVHIQAHNESLLNATDESVTEELNCVVCEKTFRSQNALNRHMNEHRRREEEILVRVTSSGRKIRERRSSEDLSTISPVKCIPCNRTFESVRAKHIHDASRHPVEQSENEVQELANRDGTGEDDQQEEYFCDCCNRRWANIRALSRHRGWLKRRSSVPAGGNPIVESLPVDEVDPLEPDPIAVEENKTGSDVSSSVKCGCCNELFPNIPALNAHLSGLANGTVTEPGSSSPNREKKDMVNIDSLRDLVKCDRCDKFCSSIPALKLHIISDHTKKSLPQSSIDGQTNAADKIVEKSVPAPANEVSIQKDESTVIVLDSPIHIPSQSNEPVVIAKSKAKRSRIFSNQQSTSREELPQHKPLQCDLCDETFSSKQALNNHKSNHVIDSTTGKSKPEKQATSPEVESFLCCNKTFATSRDLKIHQSRHTRITTVDVALVSQQNSSKQQSSKIEAAKSNNTRSGKELKDINTSTTDTESEEDVFREYKCTICGKKVASRKSLRYHREKHFKPGELDPEFNGEFSCDKCNKRFDKKTSLRVHKAYHTTMEKNSNAPIDYGCYSDLRNGTFRCNECDREFDTVKGVSMHCTKSHKEPESESEPESEAGSEPDGYSCPVCDRTFTCCQGLAGHMSRHKYELQHACGICKKTFANKSNLHRHQKLIHDEVSANDTEDEEDEEDEESEKEYPCTHCDRIFTNYRGLNGHMQMHQLYFCSECNLEFSTFRNYNIHIDSGHTTAVDFKSTKSEATKESFECNKCDRSFSSAKSLRGHKAVHSNIGRAEPEPEPDPTPELEFKCTLCDRHFSTAKSLGGHKSMHSRNGEEFEEPDDTSDDAESGAEDADNEEDQSTEFPCTRCERFFASARSLSNHMNTHVAQDNPLELMCPQPQCDRVFASHRALSAHFMAHRPSDSLQVFACPKCRETFPVMKAMYDHFCAKHRRIKKVERVSRRSLVNATSNDAENRQLSSRSRSQAAHPVVVESRKTRSKSVGDKVSSRNEKPISHARSSESVNKENSSGSIEPVNNDDAARNDEDTCTASSGVRKSLRLKSLPAKHEDEPMEVDTEEDDETKDNMQLSCVFNDCFDSISEATGSKPKCDMCTLEFDDLKSLAKHMADSHESTVNSIDKKYEFGELQIRIHQCTQCDKIFPSRVGLRRHSLSHTEPQALSLEPLSLQLQCPLCPKILPTAMGLKRHTMTMHKIASQQEISATVIPLPNSDSCRAELTQTSNVETSGKEIENLTARVDQSPVRKSASKTKSSKLTGNQITTKRSAKETECSKSKVDQTVAKQSVNEPESSETNADQTITEHSVKETDSSKSNVLGAVVEQPVVEIDCSESNADQTVIEKCESSTSNVVQAVVEQSVEKTESSKSNVDQIVVEKSVNGTENSKSNVEQSVNEPKSSKTNVDQIVVEKSDKETESSKTNVDQILVEKPNKKPENSKANVDLVEKSNKKPESSKANVDRTLFENSNKKTETSKSNVETADKKTKSWKFNVEQSVNEPKCSKTNVNRTMAQQPVDKTKGLKFDIDQTVIEQSIKETDSSKSKATKTLVEEPKHLTNGVDESTIDTNAPSSKTVEHSVQSSNNSIVPKDLPSKVTSTDIQHDHSTDDDTDTQPPVIASAPAKPDDLFSCKICSRQFSNVKAFNKHQQWHKFNDRAVDVEESSVVNDPSKQRPKSNVPLNNGMTNLEQLAYVKCDICEEKFTKADTLKKHAFDMHTVTITSPILYQCNYCHKPFPRGKTLFLHLQSHAPKNYSAVTTDLPASEEIMPFECASCEKCFRLKDDLLEHVKTHLPDSECTAASDEPLVNGSTEDAPPKVNGDPLNNSGNSENYELKIHSDDDHQDDTLKEIEQATESDPKLLQFECPRCDKKFPRKNTLTFHLRSHNIFKYEHDKQSESKPQPTIRRRRSIRLTDDDQISIISPPKQHRCPLCDESFRSKIILEMHVQKHSTSHVPKQSATKSRKSLKRINDGDDFTPDEGLKSNKRASKEVS